MKRPVPVVLSAILLGLFAAFQLMFMVLMIVAGVVVLKRGMPSSAGPQPFPPSAMPALMFGISVLCAALAVWLILTLIGLVRLRSWARYSVLVIAGLMVGFGGLSMLASLAVPFLMPSLPATAGQPAPDPSLMRIIFFATGGFYAVVTALGAALLVYFCLAKTRAIFALNAPPAIGPPNTSTGRQRPTAITVISWIYMLSAPFCLINVLLPFPGFLFGFVFHEAAAKLEYVAYAILAFMPGYGLYRLWNWARIAVFALFGLGIVNMLVLVTPWGSSQFHVYMDTVNTSMFVYGGQQPLQNFSSYAGMAWFGVILGTTFCVVILWLLHRHREAFTPAPPAPPMPPQPELAAGLTP